MSSRGQKGSKNVVVTAKRVAAARARSSVQVLSLRVSFHHAPRAILITPQANLFCGCAIKTLARAFNGSSQCFFQKSTVGKTIPIELTNRKHEPWRDIRKEIGLLQAVFRAKRCITLAAKDDFHLLSSNGQCQQTNRNDRRGVDSASSENEGASTLLHKIGPKSRRFGAEHLSACLVATGSVRARDKVRTMGVDNNAIDLVQRPATATGSSRGGTSRARLRIGCNLRARYSKSALCLGYPPHLYKVERGRLFLVDRSLCPWIHLQGNLGAKPRANRNHIVSSLESKDDD